MSTIKKLFQQNLKWYREQQGLSQSELSTQCDYDRTYVGKIERGEKDPSLEAIIRLTRELDISIINFFRSDRPETSQTVARSLKEGRDLYQTIFDSPHRMVALIDTEGQFIEINDTFLEFLNENREELHGEPIWNCTFWGDSEWREQWLEKKVEEATQGNVLDTTMEIYPDGDNSTQILDFTLTPVENDQTSVNYIMVDAQLSESSPSEQSLIRQLT